MILENILMTSAFGRTMNRRYPLKWLYMLSAFCSEGYAGTRVDPISLQIDSNASLRIAPAALDRMQLGSQDGVVGLPGDFSSWTARPVPFAFPVTTRETGVAT